MSTACIVEYSHSSRCKVGTNKKPCSSKRRIQVYSTDKVRDVVAVREPASRPTGWKVDSIRVCIGTGSGEEEVVVPTINQRISEHEKCPSSIGLRNKCGSTCQEDEPENEAEVMERHVGIVLADEWW